MTRRSASGWPGYAARSMRPTTPTMSRISRPSPMPSTMPGWSSCGTSRLPTRSSSRPTRRHSGSAPRRRRGSSRWPTPCRCLASATCSARRSCGPGWRASTGAPVSIRSSSSSSRRSMGWRRPCATWTASSSRRGDARRRRHRRGYHRQPAHGRARSRCGCGRRAVPCRRSSRCAARSTCARPTSFGSTSSGWRPATSRS